MKSIKKILSMAIVCSVFASFLAMPNASAEGEVTITPIVEVKIGSAAYTTYTDQALSKGDKVRIKYQYAGPKTNEVWSEAWYDEDNDIDYPSELKGGKSIVMSNFYVDLLDTAYMTAGTPVFYSSTTASQWMALSSTYATTGKTDTGISFATMSAYVNGGMYKDTGIITQVVYTLEKDLDKDIVIGPSGSYNYWFKYAVAGVDGAETSSEDYNTDNEGVVFNTVTLKAKSTDPDPTPTTVDGVKGKDLTGLDAGYKTFSAPAYVEMKNSTGNKIIVTKSGEGAGSQEYEFGKNTIGVVGGNVKVLPIVSYQIGRNGVAAGDVFTITLMNGETTVQTITYPVPSAE